MWLYLVGLGLVSAISGDVESRKSLSLLDSPTEGKQSSLPPNNAPDPTALFQPAPTPLMPNKLQTPFVELSLPDLSKYMPNSAVPIPKGSVSTVNYRVPEYQVPKAAPYDFNYPPNYVPDYNKYSPISPVSNEPILLHTQHPQNGMLQPILAVPYHPPQKPINCDNSEVLTQIWMILSNLLESGGAPAITHVDQIKYALTLIKKYLQETHTGSQNNELMWRLMFLETELEKGNHPVLNDQRPINLNVIPIQNDPTKKLHPQYEMPSNFNLKCREAYLKLIQWAREAYGNIIKGNCGYSALDSSAKYEGNINSAPYDLPRNLNVQVPYAYYQLLNQNPQNVAPSSYVQSSGTSYPTFTGQFSQLPHNAATNSYFQMASTFPIITQSNQDQHDTAANSFVQTSGSFYNPLTNQFNQNPYYSAAASIYQTSDIKNPPNNLLEQLKSPENINPSYMLPPPHLYQRERPFNQPYLMPTSQVSSSTATIGTILSPQIPFHGNFATNLQHITGITNKLLPKNLYQHGNPNLYPGTAAVRANNLISPKDDATELPSAIHAVNVQPNQLLDATAVQRFMQNVPLSNGYYENMQKYLNSQFDQTRWNIPQQYGAYQISYQNFPYINNAKSPYTEIKDNTYDLTRNNVYGFSQNLYQSTLPTQSALPAIDWNGIASNTKLNSGDTPNGEVELTYALKRPKPENQPLYFVKYRLPYDLFMQNVKNLLSTRSGKSDLSKDLVLRSNASEIPQDLASYAKEEVRDLVVRDGDLIKARYIEVNRTDDHASSAEESINALLSKAINAENNLNALNAVNKLETNVTHPVARNMANPYEHGIGRPALLQPAVNTYQYQQDGHGPYQNGASPLQFGWNGPGLPQTGVVNPYNPVNPGLLGDHSNNISAQKTNALFHP